MTVNFVSSGSRSSQEKPTTCHKSLPNVLPKVVLSRIHTPRDIHLFYAMIHPLPPSFRKPTLQLPLQEHFEDTKGVIRNRKSQDRPKGNQKP